MQHNAATQYHQDPYALDHGTYYQSRSNTTLSSPEPGQLAIDQYGRSHYQTAYTDQQDLGLGYGSPMYAHTPLQQSVSQ